MKLKRSGKIKGNLVDNNYRDILNPFPAEQELDDTVELDDSLFYKSLINDRSISSENSSKTSGFHSSFCPDLRILAGSSDQNQTLTNELSYFDGSNLKNSTVITLENRTLKEKLKTLLVRDSIISNNDSDDDKSDTEVINQDNPVIVNNEEMGVVIPNSQQVSLRDALEVIPLFDGSNLPL